LLVFTLKLLVLVLKLLQTLILLRESDVPFPALLFHFALVCVDLGKSVMQSEQKTRPNRVSMMSRSGIRDQTSKTRKRKRGQEEEEEGGRTFVGGQ